MTKDLYLNELIIGNELLISFVFNGKEFEFPVKVKYTNSTEIFCDVIRINGYLLPLDKSDIRVDLIFYRQDEKPIIWKNNIVIVSRGKQSEPYYIFSNKKGKEFNRRKDFRVPIGLSGEISVANKSPNKAIIRDLSFSGFSIAVDRGLVVEENDSIDICFSDFNLNYQLFLTGTVVRIEDFEDKLVYGCYLSKNYPQIGQYLGLKQREALIRHSKFVDKKTKDSFELVKKTRKVIK